MQNSGSMVDYHALGVDEWPTLQKIRLRALKESPDTFLATREQEQNYDESRWRSEFDRGEWIIGLVDGKEISLVGVTHEADADDPRREKHYIEYMWVAPECRRSGIGYRMLDFALDRLYKSGVQSVNLWVLDGNTPAAALYEQMGFRRTKVVNLLTNEKPGRSEEAMWLDLSQHQPSEQRPSSVG
jgi:ribosomal protein S18 acetylase RimI-like enzyme